MIDIHPVTPDRWPDLERLFGPNGATSGCWCMWWRVTSSDFDKEGGPPLKARLRDLVDSGRTPGLLAYQGGEPVGWVSIGARDEFGRLNRSPKLKPIDDQSVCSVVCFFIDRNHRRSGLASALLESAVERAGSSGYRLIEGYPIDTSVRARGAADLFTGTLDLFEGAGFQETARRGGRPIVRRQV
jgi:ribosomal protein S18 acetylase RimI-like enzyme